MNDVSQILGGDAPASGGSRESSRWEVKAGQDPSKAMGMTGVSREVMHLLGGKQDPKSAALPPIVPTFTTKDSQETESADKAVKVKVGNKWISSDKPARKWTWAPFASSSRTDGALFNHWVRANVEYTDYPYAKFDIHLDQVSYSDEEYAKYLKSDRWTKSETDNLMELARKFELRWAVIHDRWFDFYHSEASGDNPISRTIDDLQQRYYSVAAILSQIRISHEAAVEAQKLSAIIPDQSAPDAKERTEAVLLETAAAKSLARSNLKNQPLMNTIGTGTSNKMFDAAFERERRTQIDHMWNRTKEEELEEIELRKELKVIEAQLRKLKKMGGHIIASSQTASAGASRLNSAASSRNPSRAVSPVPGANIADSPVVLDQSFASTAPIPMPQNPFLQSGRLAPPAIGGAAGLNKTLLTKMDQTLNEMKIPPRPIPTKRVCDLYDSVRKNVLTLLTLRKMVMQKEGNIQSKRVKLSKMRGGESHVPDEEALLGIASPTAAPTSSPATGKGSKSKGAKSKASGSSKTKATGQGKSGGQKNTAQKSKYVDSGKADTGEGAKKPKATAKRKRKAEPKNQTAANPAAAASSPAGAAVAPTTATAAPPASASKAGKVAAKSGTAGSADSKQAGAKKRARKN
eukprot:scaffold1019_cov123-Cylindrotheca_fusiformis.AAC.8